MPDFFNLRNKTILITGGSSGIGLATAKICAEYGASIVLVARNKERLINAFKQLEGIGNHSYYSLDLTSDDSLRELVNQLPKLDGLVLNAGKVKTVPIRFIKREDLEYMFNLTLHSSIILVQNLLKMKKIVPGSSICFISSVSSKKISLGYSLYSSAKGALNSFTRSLALELASKQIRVNAILPGLVQTEGVKNGALTEDQLIEHLKEYPLGRFGQTEDVGGLVLYLMADISGWMTGSLLTIDGGYTLR